MVTHFHIRRIYRGSFKANNLPPLILNHHTSHQVRANYAAPFSFPVHRLSHLSSSFCSSHLFSFSAFWSIGLHELCTVSRRPITNTGFPHRRSIQFRIPNLIRKAVIKTHHWQTRDIVIDSSNKRRDAEDQTWRCELRSGCAHNGAVIGPKPLDGGASCCSGSGIATCVLESVRCNVFRPATSSSATRCSLTATTDRHYLGPPYFCSVAAPVSAATATSTTSAKSSSSPNRCEPWNVLLSSSILATESPPAAIRRLCVFVATPTTAASSTIPTRPNIFWFPILDTLRELCIPILLLPAELLQPSATFGSRPFPWAHSAASAATRVSEYCSSTLDSAVPYQPFLPTRNLYDWSYKRFPLHRNHKSSISKSHSSNSRPEPITSTNTQQLSLWCASRVPPVRWKDVRLLPEQLLSPTPSGPASYAYADTR